MNEAGSQRYKHFLLPFGWKYTPAPCHLHVKALVQPAVLHLHGPVGNSVYLGDIVLGAHRQRWKGAVIRQH